jgi:hypothetical protein
MAEIETRGPGHAPSPASHDESTEVRRSSESSPPADEAAGGAPLLRTPRRGAPLAAIGGWLSAWGAAATAAACLTTAGVGVGIGLGIADGPSGVDSGFSAGLWLLVIQAGAFLIGGYVAARMARTAALMHAALAWLFAMLATGADAIVANARDGESVVRALDIPSWAGHGYATDRIGIPLAIFAVASLVVALWGGAIAGGVTRTERSPFQELRFGRSRRAA